MPTHAPLSICKLLYDVCSLFLACFSPAQRGDLWAAVSVRAAKRQVRHERSRTPGLFIACPSSASRYIRRIDGYLPTADVAFLDEIFKANSAILNSLLAVLNERKFDNGDQQITVPLKSMVSAQWRRVKGHGQRQNRLSHAISRRQVCASNETPESDEMDALYDRFLLRRQVQQISAGGLRSLIQGADEAGAASLSAEKEKQDEDADADADADADDRSAQAGLLDDVIVRPPRFDLKPCGA